MRRQALVALIGVAILATLAACTGADHHHRRFENAEEWAKRFDDPARDTWQKPDEVVRALKLTGSETIADIGAGTGYFAARLARAVPRGEVIAIDLEPDMVRYLSERAKREGLANLRAHQAAPRSGRLPAPVDLAILVDVYHHISNRSAYFAELRASLKPGGRLVIIDFNEASTIGPPVRHRIQPLQVRKELEPAGLTQVAQHDFLPNQYFIEFKPR